MFSVSVIVWSNCHILQFLHQMLNVSMQIAAGRRIQAGDANDQRCDQWNAAIVCLTQWDLSDSDSEIIWKSVNIW